MSDKFLAVARRILDEPGLISTTAAMEEPDEIYFTFKNAVMSIIQRENSTDWGRFSLYIYPKSKSIDAVMSSYQSGNPEDGSPMVALHAGSSPEAQRVLGQLYKLVKDKDLGVDELFDRLLS